MTTRVCPGADKIPHTLDVSLFGSNKSRADGLAVYCRKCNAAKQRAWKQAHPQKVKNDREKNRQNKGLVGA